MLGAESHRGIGHRPWAYTLECVYPAAPLLKEGKLLVFPKRPKRRKVRARG